MADQLRIRFETVKMGELWRYCKVDPRLWKGTSQVVPNSQIPESSWSETPTERIGDPAGIVDQALRLRHWISEDWGFVRDVAVTTLAGEPVDLEAWVLEEVLRGDRG